jgi:hypothetical protein
VQDEFKPIEFPCELNCLTALATAINSLPLFPPVMSQSAFELEAFPRLSPLDIERLIFEVAALFRPLGIPTLMLVACRVKHWLVLVPLLRVEDND